VKDRWNLKKIIIIILGGWMRIREGWKELKHIFLVRRTRNSNQQGWIEREDPVDEDGRDRERRKKIEWKDNGLRYEGLKIVFGGTME
jgi:hypothetical protein